MKDDLVLSDESKISHAGFDKKIDIQANKTNIPSEESNESAIYDRFVKIDKQVFKAEQHDSLCSLMVFECEYADKQQPGETNPDSAAAKEHLQSVKFAGVVDSGYFMKPVQLKPKPQHR